MYVTHWALLIVICMQWLTDYFSEQKTASERERELRTGQDGQSL